MSVTLITGCSSGFGLGAAVALAGRGGTARFGVHFFHVEPPWLAYHAECKASNREPVIAEGIAKVHPELIRALDKHVHVCVETTGASPEIWRSRSPRSRRLSSAP